MLVSGLGIKGVAPLNCVFLSDLNLGVDLGLADFKANPNKAVQEAEGLPFCVLTNNAPAFYVVTSEMWEKIDDLVLAIRKRENGDVYRNL